MQVPNNQPPPVQAPPPPPAPANYTWMPPTGGGLSIAAGIIHLIWGAILVIGGRLAGNYFGIVGLGFIGLPMLILSVVSIIGGIYAIQRRLWGLALAGAICAIIGPFALLGIAATIFIAIAKPEFNK